MLSYLFDKPAYLGLAAAGVGAARVRDPGVRRFGNRRFGTRPPAGRLGVGSEEAALEGGAVGNPPGAVASAACLRTVRSKEASALMN